MRQKLFFLWYSFWLTVMGWAFTTGAEAGESERGARVYERCAGCHSLDANRVGPMHRGVYGREAGAAEGYPYSQALRESGVVWNDDTLDSWLANPGKFVPGSRMGYRLSQARDRADIIAYLKQQSDTN